MPSEGAPKRLKFPTFRPRRVEVEIEDRNFFVEEMTEGKSREFKKIVVRLSRLNEQAQKSGEDIPDESLRLGVVLLSMCMYEVLNNNGSAPTYRLVPTDFLDNLPSSVLSALEEEARGINGLIQTNDATRAREAEREEAKNS